MEKDRLDLLDLAISVIELKFGPQTSYEELYELLDIHFPKMRFTIDEIVECHSLAIDIEDVYLTLRNTGNEG